jgi:F-type H+-transporting ATPase subunit delta
MKVPKEARKLARTLFRGSFTDGRLDAAKVSGAVRDTIAAKPRQYLSAIKELQRLIRIELDRRHAVIESATALDAAASDKLVADLRARYGSDITTEFKVTPELIGGLRIKLGSDVWDSTVRGRLTALESSLSA